MHTKAVLRLLCGLVDGIIVMFASQVILIGLFDIHTGAGFAAQAYFMMIFCVYNALFVRQPITLRSTIQQRFNVAFM